MKTLFLSLLFMFCQTLSAPQSNQLLIPRNIQKAYTNGTRSQDGKPGKNYWQNRADYTIQVNLAPPDRMISGHESIVYYNQSPDSLDHLVIRLYQDIYKMGNPRDFTAEATDLHQGVEIKHFKINGQNISLTDNSGVSRKKTNLFAKITPKIAPQDSVRLELDWEFQLALNSAGRFGAYDSTSFFLAYWYPQIAVYDDIDGWDEFNYHGIQEFYNDFNNYDVSITVPKGFVVWATGRLQNPGEVLSGDFLHRYQQAFRDTSFIHLITAEDLKRGGVTAQKAKNTWRFKAKDVSDFAFGTSDHYLWDLIGMPAPNQEDGRILIAAAYHEGAKFLPGVTELQKRSIQFYSQEMPGIPFPFPSFTLFQLRGGMEYPMMNSLGDSKEIVYHTFAATHELAHSYFPMLVGTNERKYAWMDEGWAMFLPDELQKRELGGVDIVSILSKRFYYPLIGGEFDLPPMIPSIVYGTDCFAEYRYASYARPLKAYQMLSDMIGKERFRTALREYIRRWQRKHPMPFDFFNTFNDVLGENLNWFWKPWFFEIVYPNLALRKVKISQDSLRVTVVNKGGLPLPVHLLITYKDGTTQTVKKTARVWQTRKNEVVITSPAKGTVEKIELGNAHIPDTDISDNVLYTKGNFKK